MTPRTATAPLPKEVPLQDDARVPSSLESLTSCCDDPLEYDTECFSTDEVTRAQQYGAIFVCLSLLERWLELGVRPSNPELFNRALSLYVLKGKNEEDDDDDDDSTTTDHNGSKVLVVESLWKDPEWDDDLSLLKELVETARRCLWEATPKPGSDDHLLVQSSHIPGANLGLFAAQNLPKHAICCYYYGNVHSVQSSQAAATAADASYLLRIGTTASKPWWYDALAVVVSNNERTMMTDTKKKKNLVDGVQLLDWLRNEWDHQLGGALQFGAEEFFVDPSTNANIKARYINDCLEPHRYNVAFVPDPPRERAAVVTLRTIQPGEELYVSYGQAYWDSLEATTGIVPRKLPEEQREETC